MEYLRRLFRLNLGIFFCGFGSYITIKANIGLTPWDALSMGISNVTGMRFGDASVLIGLVILAVDFFLHEKIGFGTLINTVLIGKLVDIFDYFECLPVIQNFWAGLFMVLLGQVFMSVGSYFYIGAAMGCGPRDSLMVALGKRSRGCPIGVVRGGLEASVLAIGFMMGAKVGIGTLVSAFGIGFILQMTFLLLKFDVKSVCHESCFATMRRLCNRENCLTKLI